MPDTNHGPSLAKLTEAIEDLHKSLTSATIDLPDGLDKANQEFCLAQGLQFVEGLRTQLTAFKGGDKSDICVFECPKK
jgi:hypothetical protein